MKITEVQNGIRTKQKESDYTGYCPKCKNNRPLEFIDGEIEDIMDKYDSMKGDILRCKDCGTYYLSYEIGDYEYYCLIEITYEGSP